MDDVPVVPTGAPDGFVPHTHRQVVTVPRPREAVWRWLNDPATFIDSQIPPWRVEVLEPGSDPRFGATGATGAPEGTQSASAGFAPGMLNVHHGPGMLFAGVIAEIRPLEYRDLRYWYGSHAISLRLIRPTRLQFWVDADTAGTRVTVQVDALVRPWLAGPWDLLQSVFWGRFGRWMDRSLASPDER